MHRATGALKESTRQAYLEAMGIQVWYPRVVLPYARVARVIRQEEYQPVKSLSDPGTSAGAVMVSESAVISTSSPAIASSCDSSEKTPAVPVRAADILGAFPDTIHENPRTETTSVVPPVKNIAPTPFRLIIQEINPETLMVADMPVKGVNPFTRFHQQLLGDILHALCFSDISCRQLVREFSWPLGGTDYSRGLMSRIQQDDQAAHEAVCAFLENQFGLSRRRFLLVLGHSAVRFLIDPDGAFDNLRGVHPGVSEGQRIIVSHGLDELMKVPGLKEECWQDISALRALL
ncbi:hypothetical protein CI610_00118 [invertebrate metagenome]|uniref:Uncharacterized protein n=1 Tax=invertebrate metagenome TaxID=1711999 RepID=A0A2H9TC92_9ZZZZ